MECSLYLAQNTLCIVSNPENLASDKLKKKKKKKNTTMSEQFQDQISQS